MGTKYFTVCNLAFLDRALTLAESVDKYGEELTIYVFDKKVDLGGLPEYADLVWMEELEIPSFKKLAFKYDITELSTSLKAFIARSILKEGNQKVIFLDPDVCVYSSLKPIELELDNAPILLTPHFTSPEEGGDLAMLRFGSFNLGFFGIKNTTEGIEFLDWWHERCIDHCFFETQWGLSTDQKWVSIAPCFFENLKVSFDKGWNMAPWNLHERKLTLSENKYSVNNENLLVFFHFSSFDSTNPMLLSKRIPLPVERNDEFKKIIAEYAESLDKHNKQVGLHKYAYNYFDNGDYISHALRRAYSSVIDQFDDIQDPFNSLSRVYKFARYNNLLEKGEIVYKSMGFESVASYRWQFRIINFLMRTVLKILGPNRFMNLSRLLVFLSSYRLNQDLWKIPQDK